MHRTDESIPDSSPISIRIRMKPTDLIYVNVTGTNHSTRNTKAITERFDGLGIAIDANGTALSTIPTLKNLPAAGGASKAMPLFPIAEIQAAQKVNDVPQVKAIQLAYAEQVKAYEAEQGSVSPNQAVAKSVMQYLEEVHGFRQEDSSSHFILKADDIDVTVAALADSGRTLYTVSATAVFG